MDRAIHKIDAADLAVGRVATLAVNFLRGKHKPEFIPRIDAGDIVEVINIDKLKFTGKKLDQKTYYSFSGYPSGLKEKTMGKVLNKQDGAAEILRRAVRDMLPPVRFRDDMLKRLIIR